MKQETDQVLPFLSSPPTPRGSTSLRTEKDLQVTFSDLDKLFDSPDEDEEDSKPVSYEIKDFKVSMTRNFVQYFFITLQRSLEFAL